MSRTSRALAPARNITLLIALALILFYATIHWGGVLREDRSMYLLALGLVAVVAALWRSGIQDAPRLDAVFRWLLPLLPAYAVLQIVPLPTNLVAVLSPARGQVLALLAPLGISSPFASLSVYPSGTLQQLLVISGQILVFLLVRELMWFFAERRWLLAVPIVVTALWQAVLGMSQYWSANHSAVSGNYANRNHFAGLLELALPFAVAYPIAMFRQTDYREGISATAAIKASTSCAIAAALLVGIMFSLSRMGFVSALLSLVVMGVLVALSSPLVRRLAVPAAKGVAVVAVLGGVLITFLFLPPDQLVARFGRIAADAPEGRAQLWSESFKLFRAYPIVGCGLGGYESAFPKYKSSGPLVSDDHAHNDYLQYLSETGVAGGMIFFALIVTTVRAPFRVAVSKADPSTWALALACAGSLSAILLHSTADFNLYIPANAMIVSWVAGIGAALVRPDVRQVTDNNLRA